MSIKTCANCGHIYSSNAPLLVRVCGKPQEIHSFEVRGRRFENLCKDCLRIAIRSTAVARGESETVVTLD